MLGPIASQQVLDVNGVFAASQVIEISSAATAIELADAQPSHDRYLFRTVPSDDLQGKAVAVFATNKSGTADAGVGSAASHATCTSMAIINASDAYGEGLFNSVSANMVTAGGTVVAHVEVPESLVSDYSAQVAQVLAANPQCLGLFTYDDVGAAIVRAVVTARGQNPASVPPALLHRRHRRRLRPGLHHRRTARPGQRRRRQRRQRSRLRHQPGQRPADARVPRLPRSLLRQLPARRRAGHRLVRLQHLRRGHAG